MYSLYPSDAKKISQNEFDLKDDFLKRTKQMIIPA